MTPDVAADLAARTLAAIDRDGPNLWDDDQNTADRERVASDLLTIRDCHTRLDWLDDPLLARIESRAVDDLTRTAALYGVTP